MLLVYIYGFLRSRLYETFHTDTSGALTLQLCLTTCFKRIRAYLIAPKQANAVKITKINMWFGLLEGKVV
jgi:hypothetical protein